MSSIHFKRALRRSALSVALGATLAATAGLAIAQSSAGSVFGTTQGGGTVTIENMGTGQRRQITAGTDGRFTFPQLPTGDYRVISGAATREVHVAVGTGTQVDFALDAQGAPVELDAIEVVATSISPIDVSSVESTTVFSSRQIDKLPVARDITNIALLAPGTVKGDPGFGNVASFGGASAAENGYYVNGFDVTNMRTFLSYAKVPFNAIGETQVKTGGYGAEFGRSLGGVVSVVTKRGSNEWHYGGALIWTPEFLRTRDDDTVDLVNPARYYSFGEHNVNDQLRYNAYVSGPIIKDRLFFYALAEGKRDTWESFGEHSSNKARSTTPQGLLKVDWNITDNHLLEFTGISNRATDKYINYTTDLNGTGGFEAGEAYLTEHGREVSRAKYEKGGEVYIAKYTGYLTDDFTLSAQYGELKNLIGAKQPRNLDGADCPWVLDGRVLRDGSPGRNGTGGTALVERGCWNVPAGQTSIVDPVPEDPFDQRKAWRIDGDWQLGDHKLRFGYDAEQFTSSNLGSTITGGEYWRYYRYVPGDRVLGGRVNGATPPAGTTQYARRRISRSISGEYEVENTAAYIEDSWQATDNLLLYAGLRSETFDNKNNEGETFAKSDELIAPRLGFAWDVNGDASTKIYANAGRYYIPIASNTNIRTNGAEFFEHTFWTFEGEDARTGAPLRLINQIGVPQVLSEGTVPRPGTVTATTLKPMYQDEMIVGIQHQFSEKWSGGIRGVYRKIGAGMDDYCYHGAFESWAADNGHTNFDSSTVPGCVMINPGEDNGFMVDVNNDGNLQEVLIPAEYFLLPKYKRSYQGLEFFWERAWDSVWSLQGSYTYSHSYGNAEGYVQSSLQQIDAGITQDFDFPSLVDHAYGDLPNDRRHQLKLFGVYEFAKDWQVSGNLLVSSGRPYSCFGFVPWDAVDEPESIQYGAAAYYCNDGLVNVGTAQSPDWRRNQVASPRGTAGRTPWTYQFDLGLAWQPDVWAGQLTVKLDVFNLFNANRTTRVNEFHDEGGRDQPSASPYYGMWTNRQGDRYGQVTVRYDF